MWIFQRKNVIVCPSQPDIKNLIDFLMCQLLSQTTVNSTALKVSSLKFHAIIPVTFLRVILQQYVMGQIHQGTLKKKSSGTTLLPSGYYKLTESMKKLSALAQWAEYLLVAILEAPSKIF